MNEIENTLRSLLRNNIVVFTFRKVNGEIRHAKGTRNLTIASAYTNTRIPTPTGDMQPNSYYDVESNGWRSWKTGCVISIDGVVARTDTDFAKNPTLPNEPKKGELPKREIPISKPMGGVSGGKPMNGGADIDNLGGLLGGLLGGFGGGIPKDEIRKAMGDLDKDIEFVPLGGKGGYGKVGVPTATEKGIALPLGEIGVEDFAKMVAHYVVEELVSRIKSL